MYRIRAGGTSQRVPLAGPLRRRQAVTPDRNRTQWSDSIPCAECAASLDGDFTNCGHVNCSRTAGFSPCVIQPGSATIDADMKRGHALLTLLVLAAGLAIA